MSDPRRVHAPVRMHIYGNIDDERDRQDARWGGIPGHERRDDHTYAAVLGEEFGECCKAWLERDVAALREELVQTAAVAVAWIEEIDNGGARARPWSAGCRCVAPRAGLVRRPVISLNGCCGVCGGVVLQTLAGREERGPGFTALGSDVLGSSRPASCCNDPGDCDGCDR